MGGCGNAGCTCTNCTCAPGQCSCSKCSFAPLMTELGKAMPPLTPICRNEQFGHAACMSHFDYRSLAASDFGVLDMDNIFAFAIMGGT